MDQKQDHYTVGRWFQIIWLSLIAAPLAIALHEWALRKTASRAISTLVVLPEIAMYAVLLVCSCGVFYLIMNIVPLRWQHLRNSGRYPSVWLSGILGGFLAYPLSAVLVASSLGSALPHFSAAVWCISVLIFVCSLVAAMLVHRCQKVGVVNWIAEGIWPHRATDPVNVRDLADRQTREANAPAAPPRDLLTLSSDVSALLKWIRQESPIDDPSLDILGRQAVARRIARLVCSPLGEDVDIGLCGALGSGKSSVIGMLEHELKSSRPIGSPDIWLCKISCWGFSDSAAILEHVLKRAIETIENHVCSSALLRMPEDYRSAISGAGEWMAALFHLLGGSSEPGEQLERMRPMLKSLRARLVLIIEDLERNTSAGFDPEHIQALLHRFKAVDGVSFILVGKPRIAEKRLDYQKLCDHIEDLPWMDHAVVRNSVVTLRRHWLDEFPIVDPDPDRRKYEKWGEEAHSRLLLIDHLYPWKSIVDLVQTPRAFKHSLSATDKMWESLHGEIDLDDLLVLKQA